MGKFFKPMPNITYNGVPCKNITQRTILTRQVRDAYASFYEHTLLDGERPDVVAHKAYGDQYYDWLCYYANEIVDPYHGWFLNEKDFNEYITIKYGSLAQAVERICYYRVKQSDATLDVSGYAALTAARKKYWTPIIDEIGNVLKYTRINHDWKTTTNQLVRLTASLNETDTSNLTIGEHVTQTVGGAVTASGDVVRTTATTVELQHIQGTFVVGNVIGMTSNVTVSVGGVENLGVTIPPDELVYWEPVSFFTHEQELNEQKRNIKLLVPSVATQTVRAHEEMLNELV